jgi:predicted nucleotidyltransferase
VAANIDIPLDRITGFCRKWQVREFSLFGSVLRADFSDKSDVDILIAFAPGRRASPEDWLAMEEELRGIFGRDVDLVERRLVTNPFRRHEILTNRRVLYAA